MFSYICTSSYITLTDTAYFLASGERTPPKQQLKYMLQVGCWPSHEKNVNNITDESHF